MSGDFRLVVLSCPQCGANLAAEGEDVVFYCTACRSGFRYDPDSPRGLAPVAASFVACPSVAPAGYAPFWLLPAQVAIAERRAAGGGLSGLMGFFLGDAQESGSPAGEGTFAIPAFATDLDRVVELAVRFTQELGRSRLLADELPAERLTGGGFGPDDAEKLAHYVLVSSEAGRPDTLQNLVYTIDFGPPRLLGVPYLAQGDVRVDALFGIRM